MAAITSAQSGPWSATSTWVGGVVPSVIDTVIIASPHNVTVDGNYVVGNDANGSAAVTTGLAAGGLVVNVGATLTFSSSVSSSLTCRCAVSINGAIQTENYPTPLPAGVSANLILNDSASLATGKYILRVGGGATIRMRGKARTRNAMLAANAATGATSVIVNTIEGWKETFESISQNIRDYAKSLNYTAGVLTSISYTT